MSMFPGATGDFPDGDLGRPEDLPPDEGGLAMAFTVYEGRLIIDFGKDVSWLGLDRATAEGLIQMLQDRLDELQ